MFVNGGGGGAIIVVFINFKVIHLCKNTVYIQVCKINLLE